MIDENLTHKHAIFDYHPIQRPHPCQMVTPTVLNIINFYAALNDGACKKLWLYADEWLQIIGYT